RELPKPAGAGKAEDAAVPVGGPAEAGQDALLPGPAGEPEALDRCVRARARRAGAGDDGVNPPLVPLGVQGDTRRVPAAEEHHPGRGPGEVPPGEVPRPGGAAAGRDGVLGRAVSGRANAPHGPGGAAALLRAERAPGGGPAGAEASLRRAADDAA